MYSNKYFAEIKLQNFDKKLQCHVQMYFKFFFETTFTFLKSA